MPKLYQIIEHHWREPHPVLCCLLKPLSVIFAAVAAKRRRDFLSSRLKSERLPVPVVVVGNIHVGGVGKTPVVSSLVLSLRQRGVKVGVISRGYGRKSTEIHLLSAASKAEDSGDEPLLLYHQTGVPISVGSSRVAAGQALLEKYPDIELIVADDGLQHYALQRDIEIVVFPVADSERQDLDLIPNGGLREPLSRLDSVDAVVVSGGVPNAAFRPSEHMFYSKIQMGEIYRLNDTEEKLDLCRLKNKKVAAVAGIAKPERFFDSLKNMGIELSQMVALPDHTDITPHDLPDADFVLITEKDAVKLADYHDSNVWVLPICAIIEPDLADFVLGRLNRK